MKLVQKTGAIAVAAAAVGLIGAGVTPVADASVRRSTGGERQPGIRNPK